MTAETTALVELMLLGAVGGVLGTWIVLRSLAFFGHAAGSASVPGVVAAEAAGLPLQVGALAAGVAFAGGAARRGRGHDVGTALSLVTALALGAILVGVGHEEEEHLAEHLLTGSLSGVSTGDVAITAAVGIAVLAGQAAAGRAWLAGGFDPVSARPRADWLLVGLVAAVVAVAATTVGALLVSAALVLPAATARLLSDRVAPMQRAAVAIGVVQGGLAFALARALDTGPGAVLAVIAAATFAGVSLWSR